MARQKAGPPAYATAPRSASRWLITALVVALLLATGTAVWAITRPDGSAETVPGDGQSSTTAPIDDSGPADGCLGGLDPTTAVLAAQEEAPITPSGAAAFVATYLRWGMQAPRPVDDLETTGPQVSTAEAWASREGSDLESVEAAVPAGSRMRASTVGQRYEVAAFSADEGRALVATTIAFVDQEGLVDPVDTMLIVRVSTNDEGRWVVDTEPSASERSDAGLPDSQSQSELRDYKSYLQGSGVAYVGGC